MNKTTTSDSDEVFSNGGPGAQLASIRKKHKYSLEYVANKLHLRVRMIELLEADAYAEMPEPVFVKGYLRAYAKLLDIDPSPLLELFQRFYVYEESPPERLLWQSRKQTNHTERWARVGTALFALVVLGAVLGWWIKNKEIETLFSAHVKTTDTSKLASESEVRLTDLSNMRSLLSPKKLHDLEFKNE